ncbi:hypothetical protein RUM44_007267 [Polyplax serrata]|uniref:Polycystin cation channel PKD1/PKD2 domain-containing protein n=1 Tax=Polyplax serrata TaxID=468196 RepID=A0ABR1B0D1_POLSC
MEEHSNLYPTSLENPMRSGQEFDEEEDEDDILRDVDSALLDDKSIEEEKLRRKLKFFFMNPVEKWQTKRRFPYKLLLLVSKIILVTIQLCFFAHHRTTFIDYVFDNRIAFSHLFLQGWDSSREITTYPPQSGTLAIYKTSEFFSVIDFAVLNYASLDDAIGPYSYADETNDLAPMEFCLRQFKECSKLLSNDGYTEDNQVVTRCVVVNAANATSRNFSSEKYFREKNVTIRFACLTNAKLSFGVKTINFKSVPSHCLKFNVSLVFDNAALDGQMRIALDVEVDEVEGKSDHKAARSLTEVILLRVLNLLVITACLLSGVLCLRAVYRAQILKQKTVALFQRHYNRTVGWEVKWEFLNLWYVTMIASDFLILVGSAMKEKIEENTFSGDELNLCGLILGTGNFLVWFSVLRYLCFFKTYNVIMLTLKIAAPALFRFMVCVLLIYAGFTFCGWLVLGPYHIKFRTLSGTSECLFALINGDDVFGTFSTLEPTKSKLIWWFCRIYLYTFISFFIYVVLSLFVSVIVDAYEVIKGGEIDACMQSEIRDFIEGFPEGEGCSVATSSLAECTIRHHPNDFRSQLTQAFCCCSGGSDRGVTRRNHHKTNS